MMNQSSKIKIHVSHIDHSRHRSQCASDLSESSTCSNMRTFILLAEVRLNNGHNLGEPCSIEFLERSIHELLCEVSNHC